MAQTTIARPRTAKPKRAAGKSPRKNPSGTFRLVIGDVKVANPESYRLGKVRLLPGVDSGRPESELNIRMLAAAPASPVPAAEEARHPRLGQSQEREITRRTRCFVKYLEKTSPLLPGEEVVRDLFTYLTAPYAGCKKRTAVLRRSTNMAELCYIIPDVRVRANGDLAYNENEAALARRPGRATRDAGEIVSAATSVAGKIPIVGPFIELFGALFSALFPATVPDYFDEVYKEITKIVNQSLKDSTIKSIQAAIENLTQVLRNEYIPAKQVRSLDNIDDRKYLFDLLNGYNLTYLYGPLGMLGLLMEKTHAQAAFPVFLLGASLRLAIFQEMARVDPKITNGQLVTPTQSSYGKPDGTVARTANDYAIHAKDIWPKILKARKAEITLNYIEPADWVGTFALIMDGSNEVWRSPVNTTKDGLDPADTQRAEQEHARYTEEQVQKLTRELSDPAKIYGDWEKLRTTPIPT